VEEAGVNLALITGEQAVRGLLPPAYRGDAVRDVLTFRGLRGLGLSIALFVPLLVLLFLLGSLVLLLLFGGILSLARRVLR